jgi:predicted dehydrogenase
MATTGLRIGIVGCGPAAMDLADRLLAIEGVSIVGCVDADLSAARTLSGRIPASSEPVAAFDGHPELLRQVTPDALIISTPQRSHYRPAMDGLQADCHLLILTPLSTSVQEAADIVGLARARDRKVALGHDFRRTPSLIRAREMIADGAIGRLSLITSTLGLPSSSGPRPMRGGVLADVGIDWVDALLWASGKPAELVSAVQALEEGGLDLSTTASIRLGDGILAAIALSGVSHAPSFEMAFHGDRGRLGTTRRSLTLEEGDGETRSIPLEESVVDVEADFVAAIRAGVPPRCPAEEALDAVRLLEAIARSAAIGQFVGLA